jgi:hypothetical protein
LIRRSAPSAPSNDVATIFNKIIFVILAGASRARRACQSKARVKPLSELGKLKGGDLRRPP